MVDPNSINAELRDLQGRLKVRKSKRLSGEEVDRQTLPEEVDLLEDLHLRYEPTAKRRAGRVPQYKLLFEGSWILCLPVVGILVLWTPLWARVPVELAVCIGGPLFLFYLTFSSIDEPIIRFGSSLVCAVSVWIMTSVVVLSLHRRLDLDTAAIMIVVVYVIAGLITFISRNSLMRNN